MTVEPLWMNTFLCRSDTCQWDAVTNGGPRVDDDNNVSFYDGHILVSVWWCGGPQIKHE